MSEHWWHVRNPKPEHYWFLFRHWEVGSGPESITIALAIHPDLESLDLTYLKKAEGGWAETVATFSVDHKTKQLEYRSQSIARIIPDQL